jgi:hypothetical protein
MKDLTMNKELELARRQLAAVDVTPYLQAVADATAERQRIAVGIETGTHRLAEIGREIADIRSGAIADPYEAGEALLADKPVACRTEGDADTQRQGITLGIRDLRLREPAAAQAESDAQNAADGVLIEAVAPSLAAIEEMAHDGATMIAAAYAAASAVTTATGSGHHRGLVDRLRDVIGSAADQRLLQRGPIPVPADIIGMLEAGEEAIALLDRAIPSQVPTPDRQPDPFYMGLAAAGAAI